VINVGIGPYHVARGLHIQGITHVIMYGEPPSISEFVHAAGRTGRNGAEGHVVALFPPQSGRAMQLMCSVIGVPWRTNRMAQVEALMEAEEAKDTKRALETSELLRRSAVDLLQSDTTRSTLSKSRLIELRSGPDGTGADGVDMHSLASVSNYTSSKFMPGLMSADGFVPAPHQLHQHDDAAECCDHDHGTEVAKSDREPAHALPQLTADDLFAE
jgi:superfamily II DNA/RNA helicase